MPLQWYGRAPEYNVDQFHHSQLFEVERLVPALGHALDTNKPKTSGFIKLAPLLYSCLIKNKLGPPVQK